MSEMSGGDVDMHHHKPTKFKLLVQDWHWLLGVSLLLALPIYGFITPLRYALIAHAVGVLFYVMLLLIYGQGFVVEGALLVLIAAILFSLLFAGWQRQRDNQERKKYQQQRPGVP